MRRVNLYTVALILVALAIAAAAAFFFGVLSVTLSKENIYAFLGNLLLNLVAEIIGIAIGIFLAARIASELARKKLKDLAPKLVELIARLREKTISDEAARSCVICAVKLISEDHLKKVLSRKSGGDAKHCWVCNLKADTDDTGDCSNCGLSGNVWSDPKLQRISEQIEIRKLESSERRPPLRDNAQ